MSKSQSLPRII